MFNEDDDDYACSDALTRRLEDENKKMKEVKWQNSSNLVHFKDENGKEQLREEFCMKCKHCSKSGHPYQRMRTTLGEKGGGVSVHYLYDGIDMRLCHKHWFRTWERCWCPNYEEEGFFHLIITSIFSVLLGG